MVGQITTYNTEWEKIPSNNIINNNSSINSVPYKPPFDIIANNEATTHRGGQRTYRKRMSRFKRRIKRRKTKKNKNKKSKK